MSRFQNRKWVIVPVSDITDDMIYYALEANRNNLRKTTDGTKAILKYEGSKPRCFYGMTTYTHSEILAILNDVNGDWYSEMN